MTPDGTVWCVETGGESIARVDPDGSVSHVRVPGNSNSLSDIALGPDGHVWFIGFQLLGRIDDNGALAEWRTGSTALNIGLPNALTVGADNAVWYTNETRNLTINRLLPSGVMDIFPVSTGKAGTEMPGIAIGPDGALWFTEIPFDQATSHAIGRMTVDGQYTRWQLSGHEPGPNRITPGPDGALWFTLRAGKIGRIVADGAVTEFPIPAGVYPFDIIAGPGGHLWFSTDQGVGRITPAGNITLYSIDDATRPIGIAAAPDGTLWIADGEGDTLWHFTPPL